MSMIRKTTTVVAVLAFAISATACSTSNYPAAYAAKSITKHHRGCVNHDIHDFHASNAQQDC